MPTFRNITYGSFENDTSISISNGTYITTSAITTSGLTVTGSIIASANVTVGNYITIINCPNYATNASAIAGSMSTGMVYQTTGTLKIVY